MVTQYFIYGVSLPKSWKKEWEEKNKKDFHSIFSKFKEDFWDLDNDNNKQSHGIMYPYSGRDGDSMIIGLILKRKTMKDYEFNLEYPVIVPLLKNKRQFQRILKDYFGIKHGFNYFYILNRN